MNDYGLIYYSKKRNEIAKDTLFNKYEKIMYKICWEYQRRYPYIVNVEEEGNICRKILGESIWLFKDDRNAKFLTFFILQLKYYFSNMTRKQFTNKAIANTFAFKKDFSEFSYHIVGTNDTNPHNKALEKDDMSYCIRKLNKDDKEIITLWSKGYTYSEIAKIKMKKAKWVDNRVCAVLRKLREDNIV